MLKLHLSSNNGLTYIADSPRIDSAGFLFISLIVWLYAKIKEIKTREMPIYDRNESIITEKIQFVK